MTQLETAEWVQQTLTEGATLKRKSNSREKLKMATFYYNNDKNIYRTFKYFSANSEIIMRRVKGEDNVRLLEISVVTWPSTDTLTEGYPLDYPWTSLLTWSSTDDDKVTPAQTPGSIPCGYVEVRAVQRRVSFQTVISIY